MRNKRSQRKPDRSVGAALKKAAAAETQAQTGVANANKALSTMLRVLTEAKAGSADERKARKAIRAAVDDFVTAKSKLKKQQKKRRKAAAKQTKANAPRAKVAARPAGKDNAPRAMAARARRTARRAKATSLNLAGKKAQDRATTATTDVASTDSVTAHPQGGAGQPDSQRRAGASSPLDLD